MWSRLPELIVLFLVIFDPLASFAVFLAATEGLSDREKRGIAVQAVLVAVALSLAVLLLGDRLLALFSLELRDFRVAGGIILGILGIKMTLGEPLTDVDKLRHNSGRAIAAIIGSPLLTGPAAITAIIVATHDHGRAVTGAAIAIVLGGTALLFLVGATLRRYLGTTTVHVLTTFLGLVTIGWGVYFVRAGLAG